MPKNVMKISKPSPSLARNDFDLSHRYVFSQNFGELRPSLCIETVPDDYFEIKASNLIRAIPMVTSPFMRAKQHVDLWFVPYSDLWHNFNQFIVEKDDPLSAAFGKSYYAPYTQLENIVLGIYNASQSGKRDILGNDIAIGAAKIFNDLGYGDYDRLFAKVYDTEKVLPSVNLWRVLAYNKIWYDEYRNKYYDSGMNSVGGTYDASVLFNVDDIPCSSVGNANIFVDTHDDVYRIAPMFQMRYRQWKKDLFTGVLPSTQFGAVSVLNTISYDSDDHNGYLRSNGKVSPGISTKYVASTSGGAVTTGSALPNTGSATTTWSSQVDVLALRKSEAIQKWRQMSLLAGSSAYDNMRAHYGVTPDHDRDHRPTYIGSVDAPLNVGDINSQAETGSAVNGLLGSVAGKGLSSLDDRVFKFMAHDFGVIMGISSLLPEAEYNSFGLDRCNALLETDDYFKPEYQNLGLEAVSSYNFDIEDTTSQQVLGYAPRYFGYKQKFDRVSHSFRRTGFSSGQFGPFAAWVTPKYDVLSSLGGTNPLACLYINPMLFDGNFAAGISTSDQFMNDQYYDVKAVRAMSELGLPQF